MTDLDSLSFERGPPPAGPLAFLRFPEAWPDKPETVTVRETHMSWVFLTDHHAWKLKKAVRYPFLDFSTRAQRKFFCSEEVRLNARLAGDVYLDTVPLTYNETGTISVGGTSEPIDWLVKMKRLPIDATLQNRLRLGHFMNGQLELLGLKLARFFATAEHAEIVPDAYLNRLRAAIESNVSDLLAGNFDVPAAQLSEVCQAQKQFLKQKEEILRERVEDGKVVEGHGDLRPEHIFLVLPEPLIIDCIEFNRCLRLLDPADEMSFLQMSCALLGFEDTGKAIFDIYQRESGDRPAAALINFYAGFEALTRARLALLHLEESPDLDSAKWRSLMLEYIDLASMYADRGRNDA